MLIDWWIVLAQIVNFLILVLLLRLILYRPLLTAMRARQERIAEERRQAEALRQEADALRQEFQRKLQRLRAEEEELRGVMRERVEAERQRRLSVAHQHVEEQRREWEDGLRLEREALLRNLGRKVVAQGENLARKALRDLASADLEQQMVAVFLQHLDELDQATRAEIGEAMATSAAAIEVRSRDPLPKALQERIRVEVSHCLGVDLQAHGRMRFRSDPEMALGIEIKLDGHQVGWSLDNYLDGVERELARALEAPAA
jgi:F-type H+-transporting ATPase subunit b